jgi:uncharacterized membrane-anchored protein YitT (DUF2179 family)
MKWLASYAIIISILFCVYSLYYATVGDNSPFWITVVVLNIPVIVFASLYLFKTR